MNNNYSSHEINPSTKQSKTKENSFGTVEVHEEMVSEVRIEEDEPPITFKVVVIGESFVGKTSLIKRLKDEDFEREYNVTVGAQFISKTIYLENQKKIKLNIWDTCGHDVFRSMTSSFYRGAAAAFLTFSISNRKSFLKIRNWYQQFSEAASLDACVFLIGTKVDERREVSEQEAVKLLKQIKGVLYFETSSETGENIQQGFQKASEAMYKLYKSSPNFRILTNPLKAHNSFLLSFEGENQPQSKKLHKKRCC